MRLGLPVSAAALLLLTSCGTGPASDDEEDDSAAKRPAHSDCKPVPAADLKQITDKFVAPAKVVSAYQVVSTEVKGYVAITVGTDGFPKGVFHKTGEIPAPSFAMYQGKLYTASGQAIRFTNGSNVPNISDLPNGYELVYLEATTHSFDCVKASLT